MARSYAKRPCTHARPLAETRRPPGERSHPTIPHVERLRPRSRKAASGRPHASHTNTPLVRVMSEPEREDQSPSDARWGYRPSLPPVPQGGGGRAPRDPIKPPPSPGTVPAGEGPRSKGGMGAGAGLPTKLATRASVATRCWRSRLAPATRLRTPVLPCDWRIKLAPVACERWRALPDAPYPPAPRPRCRLLPKLPSGGASGTVPGRPRAAPAFCLTPHDPAKARPQAGGASLNALARARQPGPSTSAPPGGVVTQPPWEVHNTRSPTREGVQPLARPPFRSR